MTYDAEELDDRLSRWHSWAEGEKLSRGHANSSLVVGQCRNNGLQYESQLDQQHAQAEKILCKGVNDQVVRMEEPHRTAIYCEARNLVTGHAVWSSPRLPQDPETRRAVVVEARAQIARRLQTAGLME